MGFKYQLSVVAVALSVAMVGCGDDGSSIVNMNAQGVPTAPTVSDVPSDGSFFNAEAGVDFASVLGGSLSTLSSRALGSSTSAFGDASQTNDPTSGLYFDDTSVEACDSGSVSSSIGTNANDELENASIVFNDCVTDGQTASGSMAFSAQSSGTTETLSISFDDFAVSGSDGYSSMDGDFSLSISEDLSASISGSTFTLVADGETTVFSNYSLNTAVDPDTGASSMGGQAVITSSQDGQISFVISPAFESTGEENPTSGVMSMTHADGSQLIIDAGTGDPATYAYTINGGGAISSGIGNWADEGLQNPLN